MAGKQFPSLAHTRLASSRCLLAVGALLLLSASYFLLLSSSSPRSNLANPSPASPTTSFLASLDRFLASPRPSTSSAAPGDLDAAIRREEEARLYGEPGGAWPAAAAPLRVYVYEMPSKFTYDLLRLFRDSYRETTNLTSNGSPVHRLIEQHSIDYWLWADLIAPESRRLLKNVIRVQQQEEADIFYIPFFTTISYFLLDKQECKALYRVWEHLSRFKLVSPVPYIRYKPGQVYLEKDVILPYVPNVDLCDSKCASETQYKRSTLLFFRGRLKIICCLEPYNMLTLLLCLTLLDHSVLPKSESKLLSLSISDQQKLNISSFFIVCFPVERHRQNMMFDFSLKQM